MIETSVPTQYAYICADLVSLHEHFHFYQILDRLQQVEDYVRCCTGQLQRRLSLFAGFINLYFIEETITFNVSTEQLITLCYGNLFQSDIVRVKMYIMSITRRDNDRRGMYVS